MLANLQLFMTDSSTYMTKILQSALSNQTCKFSKSLCCSTNFLFCSTKICFNNFCTIFFIPLLHNFDCGIYVMLFMEHFNGKCVRQFIQVSLILIFFHVPLLHSFDCGICCLYFNGSIICCLYLIFFHTYVLLSFQDTAT